MRAEPSAASGATPPRGSEDESPPETATASGSADEPDEQKEPAAPDAAVNVVELPADSAASEPTQASGEAPSLEGAEPDAPADAPETPATASETSIPPKTESIAGQPPPADTPAAPAGALALLISESGTGAEMGATIGAGSFTIGTDPTCDFVVEMAGTFEVGVCGRIWAQGNRFMLHVMATVPAILVNGETVSWAVLEDGDRLQIGNNVLRFQRIQGANGER